MERPWLSVMGLYKFDSTIFDGFKLPDGVDRDNLLNELMSELAELEVVYPNPEVFKFILEKWSGTRYPVWKHLYETTQYKYLPLNTHNMSTIGKDIQNTTQDSMDDFTLHREDKTNSDRDIDSRYEDNLSGDQKSNDKELTKGNDAFSSVENKNDWVVGFNNSDKVLHNSMDDSLKSTDDWNTDKTGNDNSDWRKQEHNTEHSDDILNGTTDRTEMSGRLKEDITEDIIDRVKNSEGNPGQYSRQMLIKQEREIAEFDIYNYIVKDFKKRFCIQVW